MNWGGAFLEKGPSPPPKTPPFSPKDLCKGLWGNGRPRGPNPGAPPPGRLQNPFYSHKDLS